MQPPMYDPNAGYDPSPGGYDPTGMSSPAQPMYTPQGAPQADWSSGGSGGKSGSPMLTISIIVLLVLGAAGAALYATDNLEVLPFIDEDEGPSPVGKWVDGSGEVVEFKSGGSVGFVGEEPEDFEYDWSTSGYTFTLKMEMEDDDGSMMSYTSKWKYDIISDDDHGDILYMSQREVTMEEGGESSTQTFEDGGDCMFLVKESTLPEGWDDETMRDIAEDLDPPSWCNMDYEDQYENSNQQNSPLNIYEAVDSVDATTNNTDDELIRLHFSYFDESLNWAFVDFKIEVGDNVYDCGFNGADECQIYEQGDNADNGKWDENEYILLREGGTDIVSEGGASVNIFIKYRGDSIYGTESVSVV